MEEIPHLFWDCEKVRLIWEHLEQVLLEYNLDGIITKTRALFGENKTIGAGWKNSILSLTRYYVWTQKFFKKQLNSIAYNNFIKDRLGLQYKIFTKKQLLDKIEPNWLILFEAFGVN